ncbi:MAG: hypothetical protein FD149_756 [Rhodospirillaceae bacterium]|nr:MAG: hypothetical protein FD149_756 [Rhodospirillaceae bacterium]
MSVVVVFNDMLRRLQSELWGKISSSDPLTGLKSWHRLLSPVGTVDTRMPKEKTACAVMCDIDHFKIVNDTHGHQTGDKVLRQIGACLQKGVRPHDLVYRYGGEEFLIYLAGATLDEANMICDRLR